jgi:putative oxidoreductase
MTTKDHLSERDQGSDLLSTAASGATLLRFILAAYWIVHWWYKVGFEGMPATESFFIKEGLPAWLAWFDISFEVVVAACLILGVYVPLICLISLPILFASMIIFAGNGFYFPLGGIELPIFWALVQIIQALLGPGVFRVKPPNWLPRVPVFRALGP